MLYIRGFILLLALCLRGTVGANDVINAPIHNEGDYWVFWVKEWDFISSSSNTLAGKDVLSKYEVAISSSRNPIVFEIGVGGEKSEVSAGINPLLVMIGAGEFLGGADKAMSFPLFPGKKWTFSYQIRQRGERRERTFNAEVLVAGEEDIKTPFGMIRALKIVRDDTSSQYLRYYSEYFYSPETKSLVTFMFDSSRGMSGTGGKRRVELIEYGKVRPPKVAQAN